jgi:hypothetical protein
MLAKRGDRRRLRGGAVARFEEGRRGMVMMAIGGSIIGVSRKRRIWV